MPDYPKIIIEISGPPRSGKSVLAIMLRELLHSVDIEVTGPSDIPLRLLDSDNVGVATRNLRQRKLHVTLVETRTGKVEQIDARIKKDALAKR